MPDINTLPKPLKRRSFTAREVASVFIKYDGRCASCAEKVKLGEYAVDHIQALDHLGAHTLDNWQLLCVGCHKLKTAKDVKASAKGRRLRGESCAGPKKAIPSRGFGRLPEGRDPKRWQSAGFNKSLRRKMNGKVERIEP
jgi:5-methylcytosine-specific restriction endonuclease McrA